MTEIDIIFALQFFRRLLENGDELFDEDLMVDILVDARLGFSDQKDRGLLYELAEIAREKYKRENNID